MGGRNTAGANTKKVSSGENRLYFLCSDEESVNQVQELKIRAVEHVKWKLMYKVFQLLE